MTLLEQIPIIDIDTHLTEPGDMWTSRAPEKYKGKVMHTRKDEYGHDKWYIDDRLVAGIGPAVVGHDNQKRPGVTNIARFEDMHPATTHAEARLRLMDSQNVRAQILYPNVIGFGASKFMELSDDLDLRLWHVTAYNDALADLQKESGNRLCSQIVLPLWDIDASIQELKRCRAMGLTGIAMSANPRDFGQPQLGHAKWAPFWDVVQDLDIPVNFHIGTVSAEPVIDNWWGEPITIREDGTDSGAYAAYFSASLFLANFNQVINLILTKMLDKYPRIKWVSVESGVGWIPFVIQSLEYSFLDLMTKEERSSYKKMPKDYLREHIYTSFWFENERSVKNYIEEFGSDNLMFQTDFPHPQALHPNLVPKIQETLGSFSEDVQHDVLHRNAEKLYGLQAY